MKETLLNAVRRYVQRYASLGGVAQTLIPGLSCIAWTTPSGLDYAISKPLVCLVLQGVKKVTSGTRTLSFQSGDSLLITADVPTVSQITIASVSEPYISLVFELDLKLIAELSVEMRLETPAQHTAVSLEPTDNEVADSALRLVHLLDRPTALPVLQVQLVREMHFWLLTGHHSAAIRQLGWPESHSQRLARAIAVLRTNFAQPLPVEQLATAAGMSSSSFYQHFRAATSLSPLQFQKQLRLIEARRMMTAEGASGSGAAYAVGYESVQQFNREYRRMFGLPPGKDIEAVKQLVEIDH
jgi:AraC-like DNA-binding protein